MLDLVKPPFLSIFHSERCLARPDVWCLKPGEIPIFRQPPGIAPALLTRQAARESCTRRSFRNQAQITLRTIEAVGLLLYGGFLNHGAPMGTPSHDHCFHCHVS